MRLLKKDTPSIFIRIGDYRDYDYINEHIKVEKKYGYVWLLKTGKSINSAYLKNIIEQKGGILLKTSAKKGNKFYFADLLSVDISLEKQMLFPNYYKEYLYYNGYELDDVKKSGFWFKIKNVREISENEVRSFIVTSNEKPIYDYAVKTRVVHMYIHNDNDLKI